MILRRLLIVAIPSVFDVLQWGYGRQDNVIGFFFQKRPIIFKKETYYVGCAAMGIWHAGDMAYQRNRFLFSKETYYFFKRDLLFLKKST